MRVGLVTIDNPRDALAKAIDLCAGFEGLRPDSRILIKPNLVVGAHRKSGTEPGSVTSAAIIEGMVQLLRERGCTRIAVGEGSIVLEEFALDTDLAFRSSGIAAVAQKYDVELVDFHAGPSERVELGDSSVRVATRALETDFFINMPVMKTHAQTKVSLGLKNLKGCLDLPSRKKFHDKLDLEQSIALLASQIPVHLTIIDGTYGLRHGPYGGDVVPINVVIAGKDRLSVDIVGSLVMDIDPRTVHHLGLYAQLIGRVVDPESLDVCGESIERVAKTVEWTFDWGPEPVRKHAVEGVLIETPGNSVCSGCSILLSAALNKFLAENKGARFDDVEICMGKEPIAKESSKQVVLLGKCPIFSNKDRKDAIRVKGCPPSMHDVYEVLKATLLDGAARSS